MIFFRQDLYYQQFLFRFTHFPFIFLSKTDPVYTKKYNPSCKIKHKIQTIRERKIKQLQNFSYKSYHLNSLKNQSLTKFIFQSPNDSLGSLGFQGICLRYWIQATMNTMILAYVRVQGRCTYLRYRDQNANPRKVKKSSSHTNLHIQRERNREGKKKKKEGGL